MDKKISSDELFRRAVENSPELKPIKGKGILGYILKGNRLKVIAVILTMFCMYGVFSFISDIVKLFLK